MSKDSLRYWLMKSEPDVFSIDDLMRRSRAGWDGVRNYQARNFMRAMSVGDRVLFYHSHANPSGVAGVAEVCRPAYPDPTQFNVAGDHYDPKATAEKPIWSQVDVRFILKFPRFVPLGELRAESVLKDMLLFSRSRLSVMPVTPGHWHHILKIAGISAP